MKPDSVRWVPALLWITVFGVGCGFAITSTRIQTQLSLLLPSNGSPVQQLLVKRLSQGSTSRLILIGLKGQEQDSLAEASIRLADMMRDTGDFTYVRNGDTPPSIADYQLLYEYRYLLSPRVRPAQFKMPKLRTALENRLQDLTAPLPPFIKSRIPNDPTGEFITILQTWMPSNWPKRHKGVWFSSNKQYALLMAETQAPGFDLDVQEQIQEKIRDAVSRINQELKARAGIQLVSTGPAIFAVESRAAIKKEAQWLSILATTLVIGFLFVRYRSVTLVGLSIVPLVSGLLVGVIAVNLVYGYVHGITLAFGTTLIGVAIDYPIHLFSHVQPDSSASTALRRIWPVMRLGVLTTAVGYGAMLLSGFPGLSQLGLFAIAGLLTAAVVTKWILPSLIPRGFEAVPLARGIVNRLDTLPRLSGVIPLGLIVSLAYLVWSDKPFWEADLANLSPISQDSKKLDAWLRKELGAPDVRDVMVLTASTEQDVLEQSERLIPTLDRIVREGAITGYDMAAPYLPSILRQQERQAALPDPRELEKQLTQAREGLPFKADIFQSFIQEVTEGKSLLPLTSQRLQDTALALKIKSLLFLEDGQWVGMVTFQGVRDRNQLIAISREQQAAGLYYLDLKHESNRMVFTYQKEVIKFLSVGAVAIIVILAMGLRSLSSALRVLFPVTGAALTVVAVLHLLGERISLFHLASLLLVVGIGLDYALFFNRQHESETDRFRTLSAILVCSVTTILVFGLLALSHTPVLHGIGSTAALGAFFCLLYSLMTPRGSTGPTIPL